MKLISELRIPFYFNIDTGSSFMRRSTLRYYFLKIQIQQMSEIDNKNGEFQIHGIGKISISIKKFVELPIILLSDDDEEIRFQAKIYVVNRFSINILIENNFLRSNGVDILTLLLINDLSVLQI
jgi:hypothetical protein